ncbi:fimbrial protein [Salmonella enterica]|nr:fimbrial-like protein [Salmonella enterica]EIZ8586853.1 fimbrial protein [Salmonella enterica subsp. enterica]EJH7009125.1 fimbrial protein [Salmonella enterica]EJH7015061.1 fimbrial protein [Salmonella enterica]EJH7440287.1 fimbrial protein [Salmonella enterica]EJH7879637.1 fimbrial protein [Salmonella enterica]
MRQTRFLMRPTLALLTALAAWQWPVAALGDDSGMNVNFSAKIVANTCLLNLKDGDNVTLPTVSRDWFYNADNTDRLQPETDDGGTPFTIQVVSCDIPSTESGGSQQLHIQFAPQSGVNPANKQVFANNAASGQANNVGVVVFSDAFHTNVLNRDGSSDVVYDLSGKAEPRFPADYTFYARYQNTGDVGNGAITSNVVVDVTYQ